MSGDFPFTAKIVSPVKCNEKPWDLWVGEIGHSSPRCDDESSEVLGAPGADAKGAATARRVPEAHPYKPLDRNHPRYPRAGVNRLKYDSMNLHGLFPQADNLNVAVCHMCGMTVKCSAVYRHLLESHGAGAEPILPPPPPAPTVKLKGSHSRSRHKKEVIPPPPPVDMHPVSIEPSSMQTSNLSRLIIPQSELQYLDEAGTSSATQGEVQVSVESGELPVVSIQDTEDLPLGENITDDIFAIMNSEGIQSADDITNATDWKNIIRDINMQEMNFSQPSDSASSQDIYSAVETPLSAYNITDTDLSSLQYTRSSSPMIPNVVDTNVNTQALKQLSTPSSTKSRAKTKTKFNLREYDPNKHCGVMTLDNPKPCTRSLTCKAHALSLRRTVEGRSKPFDTLLAEHKASKDTSATSTLPSVPPVAIPPSLLVNSSLDLSNFNGLTAEQQVNDIYASLLSVEDPNAVLPDTSSITSLLSQPGHEFMLPEKVHDGEVPILSIASPIDPTVDATPINLEEKVIEDGPPTVIPSEVCWYASSPRPLAVCTFNTSHAGGAITLGKKFATVRSSIKSSLSRSQKGSMNSYYNYNQGLSLSKTLHMNNASKCTKPEVRKLIVTCGRSSREPAYELFGHTVNGHVSRERSGSKGSVGAAKRAAPPTMLDLGYLDPLLADEKS